MSLKVYKFNMEMTCEGCANAAQKVLNKLGPDRVTNVQTDVASQTVVVTSTLHESELLETLKKTGKTVNYVGEVE